MMSGVIHKLSWYEVEELCTLLAMDIKDKSIVPFSAIVGVARGGLPIATILAHLLSVPRVFSVLVSSYDGTVRMETPVVTADSNIPLGGVRVLIVDDIVDRGATLRLLQNRYPCAETAALVAKHSGMPFVGYHQKETFDDVWIEFPWELSL